MKLRLHYRFKFPVHFTESDLNNVRVYLHNVKITQWLMDGS